MQLDGRADGDFVCEISSVEIALQGSDGYDQLGTFNFFLDIGVGDVTDIYLKEDKSSIHEYSRQQHLNYIPRRTARIAR